jgi:hypothetical protein
LTVPAYVNGRGPYPFILDTGADGSGVYQWFAKQLKLPQGRAIQLEGMTGTALVPTFKIWRLTVDGRSIGNFLADSYPNRKDSGAQAGVAGNDFMDGSIAVFDFPCHRSSYTRSRPPSHLC